jgi:hypothetical protein
MKKSPKVIKNLCIKRLIDINLLTKQQNMLINELDRWGKDDDHSKMDKELYEGLINFLDYILDSYENLMCYS